MNAKEIRYVERAMADIQTHGGALTRVYSNTSSLLQPNPDAIAEDARALIASQRIDAALVLARDMLLLTGSLVQAAAVTDDSAERLAVGETKWSRASAIATASVADARVSATLGKMIFSIVAPRGSVYELLNAQTADLFRMYLESDNLALPPVVPVPVPVAVPTTAQPITQQTLAPSTLGTKRPVQRQFTQAEIDASKYTSQRTLQNRLLMLQLAYSMALKQVPGVRIVPTAQVEYIRTIMRQVAAPPQR